MENIYERIRERTGGNIYIGVVGPVRTGKSTLIKHFMEQLVLPYMTDAYRQARARDELPQSGSGKTIMTAEPKFIPEEAAEICPDGVTHLQVRLVDTVGYMVEGAVGATEDGAPRMVTTPWFDKEIPMTEAAELGTKKVMEDHSSIGLLVTTDGTVTDIPRQDYAEAERRALQDMQAAGKPFGVVVNSRNPKGREAQELRQALEVYGAPVVVMDCRNASPEELTNLLEQLLYAFPVTCVKVYLPGWVTALEQSHPIKAALYQALLEKAESFTGMAGVQRQIGELPGVSEAKVLRANAADGTVEIRLAFPQELYFVALSERTGMEIHNDGDLMRILTELAAAKQEYSRVADALAACRATGYGIVMPTAEEMKLEPPEMTKKGAACGIKLKAGAPSIHLIRVDVDTELSPMVGDEKQSRELLDYLSGEDQARLWESNIFGRSVYTMVREGISAKLAATPKEVQLKFQGTLSRIVNSGANGLLCLIL